MRLMIAAALVVASYIVAPDVAPAGITSSKPRGNKHSRYVTFHRPKLTTYAKQYLGRVTSSGGRYTGGLTCAVNRAHLVGEFIRVWNKGRSVVLFVNDRFHHGKDTLRFLKIDTSPQAMRALGLRGMARVDSARVVDPD